MPPTAPCWAASGLGSLGGACLYSPREPRSRGSAPCSMLCARSPCQLTPCMWRARSSQRDGSGPVAGITWGLRRSRGLRRMSWGSLDHHAGGAAQDVQGWAPTGEFPSPHRQGGELPQPGFHRCTCSCVGCEGPRCLHCGTRPLPASPASYLVAWRLPASPPPLRGLEPPGSRVDSEKCSDVPRWGGPARSFTSVRAWTVCG